MSEIHAALDWQTTTEMGESVYTATARDGRVIRIQHTPIGYWDVTVDGHIPDTDDENEVGLFGSREAAVRWVERNLVRTTPQTPEHGA